MQHKNIRFGNILEVKTGYIVHGNNCFGVWGSGIAAQIKNIWPEAHLSCQEHLKQFKDKKDALGTIHTFGISHDLTLINGFTQYNFGRDPARRYVNYEAVQKVFESVAHLAAGSRNPIHDVIHYPQIGAGLANGDWAIISDIIDTVFLRYPDVRRTLWIYEP